MSVLGMLLLQNGSLPNWAIWLVYLGALAMAGLGLWLRRSERPSQETTAF